MNWNGWVRQIHRWLSIAFTVTVIANFVAMGLGDPPAWVVYSPLLPLFLLLFTGIYMFVFPSHFRLANRGERDSERRVLELFTCAQPRTCKAIDVHDVIVATRRLMNEAFEVAF